MRTNLEKWNFYLDELNKKADEYMDSICIAIPNIFYKVEHNGKINGCTINKRYYGFYLYCAKPTKLDVEKIKKLYESEIIFTSDKAYYEYKYMWGIFNGVESYATTSIKITDLVENNMVYLNLAEAEIKSNEITETNKLEKEFKELHNKDKNYDYNTNGYKFLGWQNGWKQVYFDIDGNITTDETKRKSFGYTEKYYPEYANCHKSKHKRIEVSHNNRGSENTVSCPICKIYWKYDCSD